MEKIVFIIIFFIISCQQDNKKYIEKKDLIIKDSVYKTHINRGVLKINNSYYINSNSFLIINNKIPQWLLEEGKEVYFIDDVIPPYFLFKKRGDEYFFIIKNNDTLKFKLGEF